MSHTPSDILTSWMSDGLNHSLIRCGPWQWAMLPDGDVFPVPCSVCGAAPLSAYRVSVEKVASDPKLMHIVCPECHALAVKLSKGGIPFGGLVSENRWPEEPSRGEGK